jgi:hypothetical protein
MEAPRFHDHPDSRAELFDTTRSVLSQARFEYLRTPGALLLFDGVVFVSIHSARGHLVGGFFSKCTVGFGTLPPHCIRLPGSQAFPHLCTHKIFRCHVPFSFISCKSSAEGSQRLTRSMRKQRAHIGWTRAKQVFETSSPRQFARHASPEIQFEYHCHRAPGAVASPDHGG